jgi:hypothetical protein
MDWILLILPVVICIAASVNVKRTFRKYSKVYNARGLTGAETARQILDANGLTHVAVEPISGSLTDHYDPRTNVVRLSEDVYASPSIAALGVAAHECGHAVQHAEEYAPVKIRSALVPVTNFCSHAWYFIFLAGLVLARSSVGLMLIDAAILLFAVVALFQFVTLPVEFDASRRAIRILETNGFLVDEELAGTRQVLRAAALTYVASLVNSLIQLLRLLMASNRRR